MVLDEYDTILDHMGSSDSAIEAKTRELIQNGNKRVMSNSLKCLLAISIAIAIVGKSS